MGHHLRSNSSVLDRIDVSHAWVPPRFPVRHVNHGKSVPRFLTPFFRGDRFAIFKFRAEIVEGKLRRPLEGDEFSRLNFSRFNFLT